MIETFQTDGMSQYDSERSYLSDAQGRSVTPLIQPWQMAVESEGSVQAQLSPFIRRLGRPPKDGRNNDERAAAAELQKLEEAKKAVGVCMGTEGTRLANAKRRLGFLDDEDFDDVVESTDLGEEE